MDRNCSSIDEDTDVDDEYNATKEIQKFLMKNLQLTPRRQLFEDYEKTLTFDRKHEVKSQQPEKHTPSNSMNKYELNIITELSDFRRKHPKECMTDLNHRRFRRAKEREEEFLHHAGVKRLVLNQGIIQSLINCEEKTRKTMKEQDKLNDKMRSRTRSVHFAPDNSLALSYQKHKS